MLQGAELEVRDGRLHFEGVDVAALSHQVETPFFLYSETRLTRNVHRIVDAFTRRHTATEVFYASKACSNLWVLDRVRRTGVGVEVNSAGELWKARRMGFTPRQMIFNGVAKTRAELMSAATLGIRALTVDSLHELRRLSDVAQELEVPVAVDLRVDVNVPTSTHPGLATTRGGKFGLDLDDVVAAFACARDDDCLDPQGLHLHVGSQITSVEPYVEAVTRALDLLDEIEAETGLRLGRLNIGGGLAIPYRDATACDTEDYFCSALTPEDYAAAICPLIERRRPELALFLEPGRAVAGDAAILVSRIENEKVKGIRDGDGKRSGDEHWLVIDAGFNTLLEHTNYSWYYRTVVANRAGDACDTDYRLAGPLCDGGDVFTGDDDTPWRRLPGATRVGDTLVFLDAGAYTLEMTTAYNARPRAAAYAVHNGDVTRIRTPESQEEMVSHDVDPRPGIGFGFD